jgi:PDZ domain-containing secreted protein
MILNFIPGLKADRSAAADEFYLMLSADNVPEKELTKSEFLKTIKNTNFKNKAEATNFISIRRTGDRIVITFSKDQDHQPEHQPAFY